MKTLMALVLSFGMVLLGTAPVMAAGQLMAPKAAANLNAPVKTLKPDPSLTQPAIPEPPGFRTMSDEELEGVDGEGLIGAILGGLAGMVTGALQYGIDAAVGSMTGHSTANAHDFVATVAKSAAAGAAVGAILPEP